MSDVRPWWVEFFDEAYVPTYERTGYFDASAQEVEAILAAFDLPPGSKFLDVPCGWGRHAGLLHTAGMEATGVDLSPSQLRLARERNPGPTYVETDMRAVPDGPFDAVINLFSSVGYFDDDTQDLVALRAWHEALRPEGWFVMETNHRDRLARLYDGETSPPPGATFVPRMDWEAGVVYNRVRREDGTEVESRIRLYCATELVALCRRAGFRDVHVFGSLGQDPLTPRTRLVIYGRG